LWHDEFTPLVFRTLKTNLSTNDGNERCAEDLFHATTLKYVRHLVILDTPKSSGDFDLYLSSLLGMLPLDTLESFTSQVPIRLRAFHQLLCSQAKLKSLNIRELTSPLYGIEKSPWLLQRSPWILSRLSALTELSMKLPSEMHSYNYAGILLGTILGRGPKISKLAIHPMEDPNHDGYFLLGNLFSPKLQFVKVPLCLTHLVLDNMDLKNVDYAFRSFDFLGLKVLKLLRCKHVTTCLVALVPKLQGNTCLSILDRKYVLEFRKHKTSIVIVDLTSLKLLSFKVWALPITGVDKI
jgi:hypothetical protein